MGIAICHFELTAQAIGLKGRWQVEAAAPTGKLLDYIVTWRNDN
jgi:hypothetical protein